MFLSQAKGKKKIPCKIPLQNKMSYVNLKNDKSQSGNLALILYVWIKSSRDSRKLEKMNSWKASANDHLTECFIRTWDLSLLIHLRRGHESTSCEIWELTNFSHRQIRLDLLSSRYPSSKNNLHARLAVSSISEQTTVTKRSKQTIAR